MATREEPLRALRCRDDFTTRDAGTLLDYVDQEISTAITLPGSVTVAEEGTPLGGAPHTTLDFVGGSITATDAGGGVATITLVTPPGDNLGNHTATEALDMAGFGIINVPAFETPARPKNGCAFLGTRFDIARPAERCKRWRSVYRRY